MTVNFLDQYRGEGPLRDMTVLDFSQMMMGPVATQLMGDLGALVIKVERPTVGEWERSYVPSGYRLNGESPYFLAMNRNKLGVTADLKDPTDRQFILELVAQVDAVIHNYRPGVMERLGLGYDDLSKINPRLVYAAGSGYGPAGPLATFPGQDLLAQAISGLAADSGSAGAAPSALATPVVDAATAFLLAFAVTAAVHEAGRGGSGRKIDVSLLGTALAMQCQQALVAMNTPLRYERSSTGIAAPWTDAPYGMYEATDGWVAVSMSTPSVVTRAFDLPEEWKELEPAEWFRRRDEVNQRIAAVIASMSVDSCVVVLQERGLWAAPVMSLEQILQHPQVEANSYLETMDFGQDAIRVVSTGLQMSGVQDVTRLNPPRIGEHDEVVRQATQAAGPRDA